MWPSSVLLAHFILDHPEMFAGKHVLEVRARLVCVRVCSMGFTEMVLACLRRLSLSVCVLLLEFLCYCV